MDVLGSFEELFLKKHYFNNIRQCNIQRFFILVFRVKFDIATENVKSILVVGTNCNKILSNLL